MGRANRKNLLQELREEGLPSGWTAYWQGTRTISDARCSKMLPRADVETLLDLESRPWTRGEREAIMKELQGTKTWIDDDPLLQSLWQQEVLRSASLLQDIVPHNFKQRWLGRLAKEWQEGQVPETSLWRDLLQAERKERKALLRALQSIPDPELEVWVRDELFPANRSDTLFSFLEYRTWGDPLLERIYRLSGFPGIAGLAEEWKRAGVSFSKTKEIHLSQKYLHNIIAAGWQAANSEEVLARTLQEEFQMFSQEAEKNEEEEALLHSILWKHWHEVDRSSSWADRLEPLWQDNQIWQEVASRKKGLAEAFLPFLTRSI